MGCGGSTNKDTPVKRRRMTMFQQPKVRVTVGNGVKILDGKLRVIIVFGGPGTKKGKLLQNLANVFDFQIFNIEDIIFDEISKKVEDVEPGRMIRAVQNKLKNEQELLRLDSVLKMVARKLETVDQDKFCIIDLVPNLKWMLNNQMFIKDCTNELRHFEERYPVSFVINFVLPKDKVIDKLEVECAKSPNSEGSAASGGQSDEIDTSRTQKRALLYDTSIQHFVEYFKKKDKVVSIDVSCGVPEIIWTTVLEFFEEHDLIPSTVNETVIIYAFDSNDLDEINISLYSLTVITLSSVVMDPNGDAIELIDQLCRYIDNSNDSTRNVFVVDCSGTALSKSLQKKKSKKMIQFTDSGSDCRMGKYCSVNLTEKDDPAELRAVASILNEVCLFVQNTPEDLCKWIAQTMVECRKKRRKS